jgi:hypothetical protein
VLAYIPLYLGVDRHTVGYPNSSIGEGYARTARDGVGLLNIFSVATSIMLVCICFVVGVQGFRLIRTASWQLPCPRPSVYTPTSE